jgi:SAM-dependent methyltransferase
MKRLLCVLCGGPVRHLFSARDYRRPVDRTEYSLNWCHNCEFGRLGGNFTPEAVQAYYDIAYYTHGSVSAASNKATVWERLRCHLAWLADQGVNFTPMELGAPAERSVCDIGCGSGDNLEALKNAGFHVVGIEPDAKARSLSVEIAEVFDGTAERLPPQIQARDFDIVLMSHVLEHCIDLRATLTNVCSILRPGGSVIIEVPNNAAKGFSTFGAIWPWSDIPRHINFFTERSLSSLLHSYGLEISSVRYAGYFRQFAPDWINTQKEIWAAIGTGSQPNFGLAAWLLLAQTALTQRYRKYDSVRVHASRGRQPIWGTPKT